VEYGDGSERLSFDHGRRDGYSGKRGVRDNLSGC